ncbi:type IV secretion system protein VirB1 [Neorhizobium sp. DT-125]|uniref:type IV secretion system protein VirB1 n=1 Tax=Neorhizobium sp. DT-125 TaxID=3396163 RepID=UPI003F1D2CC9
MPITFADLAHTCAPTIEVTTLAGIASIESELSPWAIRINTGYPLAKQPGSKAEAIEVASSMIAEGHSLDLGLAGVNSSQISRLGLTLSDAFDACSNLRGAATLLEGYYRIAVSGGATQSAASATMLRSYYGQGDASVGEMVGYDRRVGEEGRHLSTALATLTLATSPPAQLPQREFARSSAKAEADTASPPARPREAETGVAAARTATPHWDVFASGRSSSVLVFSSQGKE